ncbi:MAG: hypothetical protein M1829_002181 [Trizodia sp. TS-e1964]|nr:MAG: hypothetical protein M1829_002181 [Trizodia sp. TS-e1964]
MALALLLLLSTSLLCEANDIQTGGPTAISSGSAKSTSASLPEGGALAFSYIPVLPLEWKPRYSPPRVSVITAYNSLVELNLNLFQNSNTTKVQIRLDDNASNGTVPATLSSFASPSPLAGDVLGLPDLNNDPLGIFLGPSNSAILLKGYDENRVSQPPPWRSFILSAGALTLNILAINGDPWNTSISKSIFIDDHPELVLPSGGDSSCLNPLILTFEGPIKDDRYNITIPVQLLRNDTSCLVHDKEPNTSTSYSLGLPFLQALYLVSSKSIPGNFYFAPAIPKPNAPISGKEFSIDSSLSSSGGSSTTTTTVAPTSTSSPQTSTSSGDSSVNVGAIAGGVVGGVALLVLLTVLILYLARRRRSDSPRARYDKGGVERYSSMATPLESLPDIYESQYVQPPKQYDPVHPDSHGSRAFTAQAVRGGGNPETPYSDVPESAIGIAVPGPTPLSPIAMESSSTAHDLEAEIDGREVNGDGVSVRSASPGLDDPRKHSFMPSPNPETQETRKLTRLPLFSRSRNEHGSAL